MKYLLLIFIAFSSIASFANEDEELINELEAERTEQMEAAIKLNEQKDQMVDQTTMVASKLKEAGAQNLANLDLMDEKVRAMLKDLFEKGGFHKQTHDQVRAMIMEKAKGKFLGSFFERFPKALTIAVEVLRDKAAFFALIDIMGRSDDLKTYGFVCLGIFILGWVLKKMVYNKKKSFWRNFSLKMMVNLSLTATSMYVFYTMFEAEVTPILNIIKKNI